MPDEVSTNPRRVDHARVTTDVVDKLKALAEYLCPEKKPDPKAPTMESGGDPRPSIGYWYANPIPKGQGCYCGGSSDTPGAAHRTAFLDAPGGSVVTGHFSVGFTGGSSWVSYMTAPATAGTYTLCVEAHNGTAWVGAYNVSVSVV